MSRPAPRAGARSRRSLPRRAVSAPRRGRHGPRRRRRRSRGRTRRRRSPARGTSRRGRSARRRARGAPRRDPGPAVADRDLGRAVPAPDGDRDGRSGRRMRADVGRAGCRRSGGGGRGRRSRPRDRSRSSIGRPGSTACAVSTASPTTSSSWTRLALERPAVVEARQEQQIVDEQAHALGLAADPLHRALEVVGPIGCAAVEELRVGTDGGQRRAQLVRGIRHEPPQLALGGLARAERRLDLGEHRVEGEAEAPHLGSGLGALDPPGEVARRDRRRGVADRVERLEAEPDEPEAEPGDRRRSRARSRSARSGAAGGASSPRRARDVATTSIAVAPSSADARTRYRAAGLAGDSEGARPPRDHRARWAEWIVSGSFGRRRAPARERSVGNGREHGRPVEPSAPRRASPGGAEPRRRRPGIGAIEWARLARASCRCDRAGTSSATGTSRRSPRRARPPPARGPPAGAARAATAGLSTSVTPRACSRPAAPS